jgi:hypothetical protein
LKKLIMLLIFAVVMVSGCGQENAESIYENNQDQAGEDLLTDHDGVREGDGPNFSRDLDDGMTMDDQNPNLLNTDNENRVNFSQDVRKAKEVISAQGYEPDAVWINGGTMNVTARPEGRLSREERDDAEKSLKKNLLKALPRYEINVDIE